MNKGTVQETPRPAPQGKTVGEVSPLKNMMVGQMMKKKKKMLPAILAQEKTAGFSGKTTKGKGATLNYGYGN
jgi:hypothetical protein